MCYYIGQETRAFHVIGALQVTLVYAIDLRDQFEQLGLLGRVI